MAATPRSEYVGFTVNETARLYTLRVSQPDGQSRDFVLSISIKAFLRNEIPYQDAPAICFLKLERELEARGNENTATNIRITDAELAEFRESHEKKPSTLRPRPNIKP